MAPGRSGPLVPRLSDDIAATREALSSELDLSRAGQVRRSGMAQLGAL